MNDIQIVQEIVRIAMVCPKDVATVTVGLTVDGEVRVKVYQPKCEISQFYMGSTERARGDLLATLRAFLRDECGWQVPEAADRDALEATRTKLRELKNGISEERRFEAAKAAMQGMLADPDSRRDQTAVSTLAVQYADALLAELAKPTPVLAWPCTVCPKYSAKTDKCSELGSSPAGVDRTHCKLSTRTP